MNLLAALATIAESFAAALATTPDDSRDGDSTANPFESRAGLADVVTVQVVGPDGSVKESKSTINNTHESLTRKESRP